MVGDTVTAPAPARAYAQEVGAEAGKLRIGMITTNAMETGEIHPDCVAATEDAGRLLESLGHTVEVAELPAVDPAIVGHFTTLWSSELAADLRAAARAAGKAATETDVEALTWTLAQLGEATSAADYIEAEAMCVALAQQIADWMHGTFDMLLTPTLGEPPVPLGTFNPPGDPMLGFIRSATFVPYTPIANITGQPAISLPLAWNADALPIGAHLMGTYGREDLLLRVAAQCEQARPWAERIPPIHA
jgi:amidase